MLYILYWLAILIISFILLTLIKIYKLDRLTRSLSDLEWVLKELEKYGFVYDKRIKCYFRQ